MNAQTSISCNGYNPWVANQIYDGVTIVGSNNNLYKANYYNTGFDPTQAANADKWTNLGQCVTPIVYKTLSCTGVPVWNTSTSYPSGQVQLAGRLYTARYFTGAGISPIDNNNNWQFDAACTAAANISLTPSTLSTFTSITASSSTIQSFIITASNLTGGNVVTITAPSSFEIALNQMTSFSNSITLTVDANGNIANNTVFVQYSPFNAGSDNGTIKINLGDITLQTVAVSGTATAAAVWNLSGNNNVTATSFLGTTNNQPLVLRSNGTTGLQLNNDGSSQLGQDGIVFIGPKGTNPIDKGYHKFEVNGLTSVTGPTGTTADQTNILMLYSGKYMSSSYRHYMNFSHATFPNTNTEYGIFNAYEYNNTAKTGFGKHLILQNTNDGYLGVGYFSTPPTTKFAVNGTSYFNNTVTIGSTASGNEQLKVFGNTSLGYLFQPTLATDKPYWAGGYLNCGGIVSHGADFVLGKDDNRFQGVNTGQRALVHEYSSDKDILVINYAGDFENGTQIQSNLSVSGKLTLPTASSIAFADGSTFGGYWQKTNSDIFFKDGKVGIGTDNFTNSDYILRVNGKILTKGLKVQATGWADFVFKPSYKLMDLDSLNEFVTTNQHLPEVPSEKEVIKNEGFDLEQMNKLLLQKVEELTLYTIQLHNRVKQLEANQK